MTHKEAQQWLDALHQYEYPVNLTAFRGRAQFRGDWFARDLLLGNRQQTIEFEDVNCVRQLFQGRINIRQREARETCKPGQRLICVTF